MTNSKKDVDVAIKVQQVLLKDDADVLNSNESDQAINEEHNESDKTPLYQISNHVKEERRLILHSHKSLKQIRTYKSIQASDFPTPLKSILKRSNTRTDQLQCRKSVKSPRLPALNRHFSLTNQSKTKTFHDMSAYRANNNDTTLLMRKQFNAKNKFFDRKKKSRSPSTEKSKITDTNSNDDKADTIWSNHFDSLPLINGKLKSQKIVKFKNSSSIIHQEIKHDQNNADHQNQIRFSDQKLSVDKVPAQPVDHGSSAQNQSQQDNSNSKMTKAADAMSCGRDFDKIEEDVTASLTASSAIASKMISYEEKKASPAKNEDKLKKADEDDLKDSPAQDKNSSLNSQKKKQKDQVFTLNLFQVPQELPQRKITQDMAELNDIQSESEVTEQASAGCVLRRSQFEKKEFDKLMKHLLDPNVYLLNDLRREVEKELRNSKNKDKSKQNEDMTSISIIQQIPNNPTEDGAKNPRRQMTNRLPIQDREILQSRLSQFRGQDIKDYLRESHQESILSLEELSIAGQVLQVDKSLQKFFDSDDSNVLHRQFELSDEAVKLNNGAWLQNRLDRAKPNDLIYLQQMVYKFESLYIRKPVTLIGQPETIFEVDGGSIYVDFSDNKNPDENKIGDFEASIPSYQLIQLSQEMKEKLKKHPLGRGTPLNIRRGKVARIHVIEIRYNRTKATTFLSEKSKPLQRKNNKSRYNSPEFSGEISLGATVNAFNINQYSLGQMHQQVYSKLTSLKSQNSTKIIDYTGNTSREKRKKVACFVIQNNSFLEIKDCFIKSISDRSNNDEFLDKLRRQRTSSQSRLHKEKISTTAATAATDMVLEQMHKFDTEINDYCFVLNMEDFGRAYDGDYSGLVSLQSTTIQNFMYGAYCGNDGVFVCEQSSFIALRIGGYAIKAINPKQLKFLSGSIQRCESNGVHVIIDDPSLSPQIEKIPYPYSSQNHDLDQKTEMQQTLLQHTLSLNRDEDDSVNAIADIIQNLSRKIYIVESRFTQVQGCPILIEGPPNADDTFFQYLVKVKDIKITHCGLESKLYSIPGASSTEKDQEQVQMQQAFERIGGQPQACIYFRNLHLFQLNCYRNTISRSSGSGITLQNVKGHKKDMSHVVSLPKTDYEAENFFKLCVGDEQRIVLIDNYIVEITDGYGIIIDGSTCSMTLNQLKKNTLGGLLITTSAPLPSFQPFIAQQPFTAYQDAKSIPQAVGSPRMSVIGNDNQIQARSSSALQLKQQVSPQRDPMPTLSARATEAETLPVYKTPVDQTAMLRALRLKQIKQYRVIQMDNSTALNNEQFGIGILGFYGSVIMKSIQINNNEADGLVLSRTLSYNSEQVQSAIVEDEAAFIDGIECTERSSKFLLGRNCSQKVEITDQGVTEVCIPVYRSDGISFEHLERPFDRLASTVHLFKCFLQQNRLNGVKTVDMTANVIDCKIKDNLSAAVRVCNFEKSASCNLYTRELDQYVSPDLIGDIVSGFTGRSQYKPNQRAILNPVALFDNKFREHMNAHYAEMVHLKNFDPSLLFKGQVAQDTIEKILSPKATKTSKIISIEMTQNPKRQSASPNKKRSCSRMVNFCCGGAKVQSSQVSTSNRRLQRPIMRNKSQDQ